MLLAAAMPTHSAQSERPSTYAFAFREADAAMVIDEVVGRTLGLSYTLDPAVTSKVTFRVEQRLTPSQLLQTLETTLAPQGIVMLRNGESLYFTTRANARGAVIRTGGGQGGYRTETLTLANIPPSQALEALEAMGAREMVVFSDDDSKTLVLGGSEAEIAGAKEAIEQLDRRIEPKSRWIELRNVSSDVVAKELADITAGMNMTNVRIAAIPRLRGLMVFAGSESDLEQIANVVSRLDTSSADGDGTLWYYRPRNVAAETLSATLNEVLGNGPGIAASTSSGSSSAQPSSAGTTSATSGRASRSVTAGDTETRVAVDKDSNTLVISSPPDRRLELQRLLEQLDVRPRQVLIEASVLEVTLGDEFRFGFDWSILSSNGRTLVTSTNEQTGAVAPAYPGFAVTYLSTDIDVALDALKSRTNVEVVSSPKIIVLDNRAASLQIGDQVPIVRQTSQSNVTPDAPRVVNVEYRDTGVQLEVTPRVTGDDDVTLLVTQEVSSVSRTTTSGIDSPTIQQRRFDSSLLLNSGGTVALGGLISRARSGGASGAPGVSDIPVIGNLFRSTTRDNRRTELIVLISATILADADASERATEGLLTDLPGIQSRGLSSQ